MPYAKPAETQYANVAGHYYSFTGTHNAESLEQFKIKVKGSSIYL
jgi:hypothetical protein